ncbi:MAG: LysR family transcriptional regulator [Hoeflea sp.]|nr:LysR family transcriptional regulator [Hoeflea sp.]|tara:strand:- start:23966 stop:24916 length:951 start_codon:yes stop_codon:yes gene_type:complete
MMPSLNSIASRLKLKHFRLLVAIDDHGSVLKAAPEVAMSQPGATKALKEIEDALGQVLFVRTNRGLEPNELGLCVIRHARLIQADIANLREEMAGIQEGHGGRLSVGTIMGAIPTITSKLSDLMETRPAMSVEIVEGTSAHLLKLLDDGRIDVAICRTSVSQRWDMYNTVNIREENLTVVARPDHPYADAEDVQLAELADFPWIACAANMPMRRFLEGEFLEAGLQFPLNVIETTSAFAAVSMIHRNPRLVALLPTDVAELWLETERLITLPVTLKTKSEPYYLVTCRERTPTPITRIFMDEFKPLPDEAMRVAAE